MCMVFPPIVHRIESYLIALEAFEMLGLGVSAELALEAMTKDCDNSGEHNEEKINFQQGMGANYERAEFLGDCFLKMATSIPLLAQEPKSDEEGLHIERMLMLCNKNLFNHALDLEIPKYIRSKAFSRYVNKTFWVFKILLTSMKARLVPRAETNQRQGGVAVSR